MIELHEVHKSYMTRGGPVEVLAGINLKVIKGDKLGILGRNGAGKSTLIRIISGAERPSSGQIERTMRVSWPLAFSGAFQTSLTGIDNIKFTARIYGTDTQEAVDYVESFSELGKYLREPVRNYSSGMRARLAFGISMAVNFDCYLIDEIIAVGDSRFHEKCRHELFEKRKDSALIIVSHDPTYIRDHCTRAVILNQGRLLHPSDVGEALTTYHDL
jgi:capsular polysaccharide transport system ATP-binding protein